MTHWWWCYCCFCLAVSGEMTDAARRAMTDKCGWWWMSNHYDKLAELLVCCFYSIVALPQAAMVSFRRCCGSRGSSGGEASLAMAAAE